MELMVERCLNYISKRKQEENSSPSNMIRIWYEHDTNKVPCVSLFASKITNVAGSIIAMAEAADSLDNNVSELFKAQV